MNRPAGYVALLVAAASGALAAVLPRLSVLGGEVAGFSVSALVTRGLLTAAVLLGTYGLYQLTLWALVATVESKRRVHDVRNVVRLLFLLAASVAVLGVLTERWLGVFFSLGVVGFAVTFALQQPLFSLLGWFYIMLKRPYQVGDRVKIEESKGDVIAVDFLVTTLWEIDGDLVSSNQPSGRIVTVPNSVVLSSHVYNYSWQEFPYVWNELSIQVAYETDLEFAREVMVEEADEYLGDRMAANVARYRELLADTPVELEVQERPTVNVVQEQSWVELRLRYLVNPTRGTRVRNVLYERILDRFHDEPDRVSFPVGRNR